MNMCEFLESFFDILNETNWYMVIVMVIKYKDINFKSYGACNKANFRKWQKELLKKCYSPTCRMGMMPLPITSKNDNVEGCYSLACRQAVLQSSEF